ncbi:PIN domain-containing protein [Streptomyces sp. SID1328]|uniref:PIN domain nuclease n=1 Tax=Streptomyces sp. SID1328 TaxID=2690250 RepID=UPI0013692DE4|nr:PIN domain nuclease [Streptomyces sp. SID1328]MYV42666.1 PIN domain-containing protein [Streptomyces sp. SID1328]
MDVSPQYLVDSSAMNRMKYDSVQKRLGPLISAGLVATCAALDLEALYSARNPTEYEKLRATRAAIFTYLDTNEEDWSQALDVQRSLAAKSIHRGPQIPDLIISAVAFRYQLTLLHFDSDFDRIAELTGQSMEWVVPRGSIQ